ncbi:hypothetical protein ABW19_dt0202289 [Dactylella cylindrospora]|nr:hypothetical protein ABW19_dt0202289 [Dactylella cylindrospora]
MNAQDRVSADSPAPISFASLPFDIHVLILEYLSPVDIPRLRCVSKSFYDVYTSHEICSYYLSIFCIPSDAHDLEEPSDSRTIFDSYFLTRQRVRKQRPTKAFVVEGVEIRLNSEYGDVPYYCKSPRNEKHIVAYRTSLGDLAILNFRDLSKSTVLLINSNWSFHTQPLAEYNRQLSFHGGQSHNRAASLPSIPFLGKKNTPISLSSFQVNIHSDSDTRLLVELVWKDEKNTGFSEITAPDHVNLEPWAPLTTNMKNLGMVISLDDRRKTGDEARDGDFGCPVAVFYLSRSRYSHSEYVLNDHYMAGVTATGKQFVFLRYWKKGMDTVCSLPKSTESSPGYISPWAYSGNSGNASREISVAWSLPAYIPSVVHIDLDSLGIVDYDTGFGNFRSSGLDLHIEVDRMGDVVFVITGAGVTAFDVSEVNQLVSPKVLRSYWWRRKGAMEIHLPSELEEPELGASEPRVLFEGRAEYRAGAVSAKMGLQQSNFKIAPCIPRIWKSWVPPRPSPDSSELDDMFTVIRAYNYLNRTGCSEDTAVSQWQRPDFLVSWDIPLTRKGLNHWSVELLNSRSGFRNEASKLFLVTHRIRNDMHLENPNGLYPSKIAELQSAMCENPSHVMKCFESHPVMSMIMPQTSFGRRDIHKTMPRGLAITKDGIMVDTDEFRSFVSPAKRGRWGIKLLENGVLGVRRRDWEMEEIKLDWGKEMKVERPYPIGKVDQRRSKILSLFGKNSWQSTATTNSEALERLPMGSVHHIKVGGGGTFLAYVTREQRGVMEAGLRSNRNGTLVIVRYD